MADLYPEILEIEDEAADIGTGQRCIEDVADADIGVKLAGYKDHDGVARKMLVKDQPLKNSKITISGSNTNTIAGSSFGASATTGDAFLTSEGADCYQRDQYTAAGATPNVLLSDGDQEYNTTNKTHLGSLNEAFAATQDVDNLQGEDIEDRAIDVNALGPQLFSNSFFGADTDWTKGTGWTIGSGVATKAAGSAGNLTEGSIGVDAGATYEVIFEVTSISASTFTPLVGSTSGTARSAAGWYREEIVAAGSDIAGIQATSTTAGSIDNITIRKVRDVKNNHVKPDFQWLQNLFTYSEDASNGDWARTNLTDIVASGQLSPVVDRDTGLQIEYMGLIATASSSQHRVTQTKTLTAKRWTIGVYAKEGIEDWCVIVEGVGGTLAYFDVNAGTVGTVTSGNLASLIKFPGQGALILMEFDGTAAPTQLKLQAADSNGGAVFAGDAVNQSILFCGMFVREGTIADNFPYAKTTTAAETGKHEYRHEAETVQEYRARLGLKERTDSQGLPTGIWETPQVETEYIEPDMWRGRQVYYMAFADVITVGGAQTLLSTSDWTRIRKMEGSIVDDSSAGNSAVTQYGTSNQFGSAWVQASNGQVQVLLGGSFDDVNDSYDLEFYYIKD